MGSRETDYSQHSHQHGTVMPSKNIILVSSPGLAATRTRRAGTEKNYNLWAGGSATLVTPDTNNGDVILAELECVPSVVKYKVQSAEPEHSGASDLTVTSLPSVTQPVLVFTHLYKIMYYYHYLLWLPAKLGVLYKIKCNNYQGNTLFLLV